MSVDARSPWCGKLKDAIRAAGGIITHEYKLIKGYSTYNSH